MHGDGYHASLTPVQLLAQNPVPATAVPRLRIDAPTLAAPRRFSLGGSGNRPPGWRSALSYKRSVYADDYNNGATIVPTAGKMVPATPEWMNKFVASANLGGFELQVIGDYVGKRCATYTNDLSVPSYLLTSLSVSGKLPLLDGAWLKNARWRLNVSNLTNKQEPLNVVVGASGTYMAAYADVVAPPTRGVIPLSKDERLGAPTALVDDDHNAGLLVHTWTFRPENRYLAANFRDGAGENSRNAAGSVAEMKRYIAAGLDGFFSDDPGLGRLAWSSTHKTARLQKNGVYRANTCG